MIYARLENDEGNWKASKRLECVFWILESFFERKNVEAIRLECLLVKLEGNMYNWKAISLFKLILPEFKST